MICVSIRRGDRDVRACGGGGGRRGMCGCSCDSLWGGEVIVVGTDVAIVVALELRRVVSLNGSTMLSL